MNENESCQVVEVDGEPVRIRGNVGEWDDADREAFAEIVRAAKAKYAVTADYSPADYPPLRHIEADVCEACLNGEPTECHTPGCAFWMCDALDYEQGEALRRHVVESAS